jgi:hypothetical protein
MDSAEVRAHFRLEKVLRWSRRGQWIEIYAKPHDLPSLEDGTLH